MNAARRVARAVPDWGEAAAPGNSQASSQFAANARTAPCRPQGIPESPSAGQRHTRPRNPPAFSEQLPKPACV